MLKKLTNKKGFTLMEMLIVVAIIAVLVAIAIPTFNGALTKSKESADVANIRAYYAELQIKAIDSVTESAFQIRDAMLPRMAALRVVCDEAETVTDERCWPFPTYGDLLFGVR